MNDTKYFEQMIDLTEKLNQCLSTKPFDEKKWQYLIKKYHKTNKIWLCIRLIKFWVLNFFLFIFIFFVFYIIWRIVR